MPKVVLGLRISRTPHRLGFEGNEAASARHPEAARAGRSLRERKPEKRMEVGMQPQLPYAPALKDMAEAAPTFRSSEDVGLSEEVAQALLETKPLKRLAGIGFLGAIDYALRRGSGRDPHRRRHNRREHSIGVARLAEVYALHAGMGGRERRTLVCAALLHDVGHGPLSHTLEPVFKERFGMDHHRMTRAVIEGTTRFGPEIRDVLERCGVGCEEVLALIDGEDIGDHSFLFSAPINIDTLEGISRCRAFLGLGRGPAFGAAVRRWATSGRPPRNDFDDFWLLKDSVYGLAINAPLGRRLDAVAQSYMATCPERFGPDDFLKTGRGFRKAHPDLFRYLEIVPVCGDDLQSRLPRSWLDVDVTVSDRKFFVDDRVDLVDNDDIFARYRQTRDCRSVKLGQLVEGQGYGQ